MKLPAAALTCLALSAASTAVALPQGPRAFCQAYPESPTCGGRVPSCAQCHTAPPTLNSYGEGVAASLWADSAYDYTATAFEALLPDALHQVEAEDPDGDGVESLVEISLGTAPGDGRSLPVERRPPEGENAFYDRGNYDVSFAYKRISVLYCGRPTTYEALRLIEADDATEDVIRTLLDRCLDSDYWRNEALPRLADKRIRPLEAIGFDGIIPLADYEWDYRLFSHVMTDDRDARLLLTADFHIDEDGDVVEGVIENPPGNIFGTGGQPVPPEHRAGMITSQWFLMVHTMFSALPRTTAAQAYRAYLGQDIALSEGILPVEGEPRDVDNKGVAEEACARCHSTIDPLSYAFSAYNGIGELGDLYEFGETGGYNPTRTPWGEDSVLLGQSTPSLVDWAHQAAESDMFKRNLVQMFWEHAFSRPPNSDEQEAFRLIWESLPQHDYSVNDLIWQLVRTDAFGAP